MIGQTVDKAASRSPLSISHRAYAVNAVARSAGPSRCGRPHDPVKALKFTSNLGSPSPSPSESEPEGFCTVWMIAWEET